MQTLLPLLESGNAKERATAAWRIGRISRRGGRHTNTNEPLLAALSRVLTNDDEPSVRWAAAWALGQVRGPLSLQALVMACASDPNAKVRGHAVRALGRFRDKRILERIIQALSDSSSWVRSNAALALGATRDPRAVDSLIATLNDPCEYVRRNAAFSLGRLQDRRACAPLQIAIDDPYAAVREAATFSLARLASPGLPSPRLCRVYLSDAKASMVLRPSRESRRPTRTMPVRTPTLMRR